MEWHRVSHRIWSYLVNSLAWGTLVKAMGHCPQSPKAHFCKGWLYQQVRAAPWYPCTWSSFRTSKDKTKQKPAVVAAPTWEQSKWSKYAVITGVQWDLELSCSFLGPSGYLHIASLLWAGFLSDKLRVLTVSTSQPFIWGKNLAVVAQCSVTVSCQDLNGELSWVSRLRKSWQNQLFSLPGSFTLGWFGIKLSWQRGHKIRRRKWQKVSPARVHLPWSHWGHSLWNASNCVSSTGLKSFDFFIIIIYLYTVWHSAYIFNISESWVVSTPSELFFLIGADTTPTVNGFGMKFYHFIKKIYHFFTNFRS